MCKHFFRFYSCLYVSLSSLRLDGDSSGHGGSGRDHVAAADGVVVAVRGASPGNVPCLLLQLGRIAGETSATHPSACLWQGEDMTEIG